MVSGFLSMSPIELEAESTALDERVRQLKENVVKNNSKSILAKAE